MSCLRDMISLAVKLNSMSAALWRQLLSVMDGLVSLGVGVVPG